ncbi:WhiB family transcriptional regulator [Nocardia sp. 348MFTsu5.1]|uniref:WhiB family transcriptional regulator n=1 Tax=Nocardia sp. 348MFTsu5.1 TaxID=1172185 RepID=UPI0009DBE34A|nr:WhiB family transcriptional regulator [Nocardia sp. 348MFTsu5.1]
MSIDAIISRYRTQSPTLPVPVAEEWDWQRQARCRGNDSAIFFPPNGSRGKAREELEARAKGICRQCPVRNPCRDHALASGEPYGVWGGTTAKERALWTHP